LGCEIYFAHPCHSWERGLNEHTNGLGRQYLPKGTSFEGLTQRQLDLIIEKIKAHSPSSPQGCEDTGVLAEVFSERLSRVRIELAVHYLSLYIIYENYSISRNIIHGSFNPWGFNSPHIFLDGDGGRIRTWGCGGFVPPHTQIFQGEIFNTPSLCGGDFLFFRINLARISHNDLRSSSNGLRPAINGREHSKISVPSRGKHAKHAKNLQKPGLAAMKPVIKAMEFALSPVEDCRRSAVLLCRPTFSQRGQIIFARGLIPFCGTPEAAWRGGMAVWGRAATGFAYKRRAVMPAQHFALGRGKRRSFRLSLSGAGKSL
jgi:hypothetical protein